MDDLHWYVSKFLEKRQLRQLYRDVSPMRNHVSASVQSASSSGLSKSEVPLEKMEKCLRVCRSEKLRDTERNPHADCHGNMDQVLVVPKVKYCSLRDVGMDSHCCFQMLRNPEYPEGCLCENSARDTFRPPSTSKCFCASQKPGMLSSYTSQKSPTLPYSCSCPEITQRAPQLRAGETTSYPPQDMLFVDITCGCIPKSYTYQNIVSKNGSLLEGDSCETIGSTGHLLPPSPSRRHSNDNCASPKRCANCPAHWKDRCATTSEMSPLHTFCIYQNLVSNGQLPKSGKLSSHHMLCLYPDSFCRQHPRRSSIRKVSPLCRSCTFHEIPARDSISSSPSVSSLTETLGKAITTAGNVKQFLKECGRDRHKLSAEYGSRKLSEPNVQRHGLGMVHNVSW